MDKRNVAGISALQYAVVIKDQNVAVSLHQHPDAAERFIGTLNHPEDFEVVNLLDGIGYRQR